MHQGAVMKIIKNDEAVSPVIGVILMVAITVILAAVIAAFVFGMAGSTGSSKNVGLIVQVNQTDADFRVTVQGGTDLPTLEKLEYTLGAGNNTYAQFTPSTAGYKVEVGNSYILGAATTSNIKLTIRGSFSDGASQVLFDKQF